MGLKVFKADEATCDYENSFFRGFASNLVEMFKQEGLDGILIGHPRVPANKNLKPDCVLITEHRLVLIDFKNHGGRMWLPEGAENFANMRWRHDNVVVDGGSAANPNPFAQLKRQKEWIEELIGENKFGKGGIACVVCFQQEMRLMNKVPVPGKYQRWFSITDGYSYLNRIREIIGVNGNRPVNIEEVASYFEAEPYHDYYAVSLSDMEAASKANERAILAERREAEAAEKVAELENKIAEAEVEKRDVAKIKANLEVARREASRAKEVAEKEKRAFDEKKHELSMATQKAIRAKEEANKAKAEADRERLVTKQVAMKSKTKRLAFGIAVAIAAMVVMLVVWVRLDGQSRIERAEADKLAQIEEDYKNGRKCIPVERVADFEDYKNVCVDFYANYINDSAKYVFIDNEKNGNFALMISKEILSKEDANARYLNRHLEVRGSITKYNDTYEIKVSDLSQIVVR